jgi:hypothetical protein
VAQEGEDEAAQRLRRWLPVRLRAHDQVDKPFRAEELPVLGAGFHDSVAEHQDTVAALQRRLHDPVVSFPEPEREAGIGLEFAQRAPVAISSSNCSIAAA